MLLQEPLLTWSEPVIELIGFLASFFATGAIGFRYVVLRKRLMPATAPDTEERAMHADAALRAAVIGVIGAVVSIVLLFAGLPAQAARRHVSLGTLITHNGQVTVQVALALLAVIGFALACGRLNPGWHVAAVGVIAGALSAIFFGQWTRLVNPIHRLAAGFWIGTLFVVVAAGLSTVSRSRLSGEQRGRTAADMINAFSPLALTSFAVLVIFGLITAWRHLKTLAALWTTPYGYALIAKLIVVLIVVALGAFNWRRQKPLLGTEKATGVLRSSAIAELTAATLVLVITAILVSLPSPSETPRPSPATRPAAAATSTP